MKLGRPKGSKQARNESKYWLPEGITLVIPKDDTYNKTTLLTFIDSIRGEFKSTFNALQGAKASTHPDAVMERRITTNIVRYGCSNPGANDVVKAKRQNTCKVKYGAPMPFSNPEIYKKSVDTLKERYGVAHPLQNKDILFNMKIKFFEDYGCYNPMDMQETKDKQVNTCIDRYGVTNVMYNEEIKNKLFSKKKTFVSKGELEVLDFVKGLGLNGRPSRLFKDGDTKNKGQNIDIRIDEVKMCIEYNGEYWHSEASKDRTKYYHLEKTQCCESNGYRLIHIFEKEWMNRKDQVKSYLTSALGKNTKILNARDTEFVMVEKQEASKFLDIYHIQGKSNFKYAYGLRFEGELISLITLGNHHRGGSELVLNRYVCKTNVTIRGGLSKLCKNTYRIQGEFTTWVNRRFSDGSNWIKSGWEQTMVLPPDYLYYNSKYGTLVSKQSRQKNLVGTPKEMTEHQHALKDGLLRIYDCGKIKLKYNG